MNYICIDFEYKEGTRVGYHMRFPHENGVDKNLIMYVSEKDKPRIIKEIMDRGFIRSEIEVERVVI